LQKNKSTQTLNPTHHNVIEPNPTKPTTVAKKFDPTKPNPLMDPTDGLIVETISLRRAAKTSDGQKLTKKLVTNSLTNYF